MHIGWDGGEGYIQKFPSTVLVPPQLYIVTRTPPHTHTHTHAQNIAYPLPQSIPIFP